MLMNIYLFYVMNMNIRAYNLTCDTCAEQKSELNHVHFDNFLSKIAN